MDECSALLWVGLGLLFRSWAWCVDNWTLTSCVGTVFSDVILCRGIFIFLNRVWVTDVSTPALASPAKLIPWLGVKFNCPLWVKLLGVWNVGLTWTLAAGLARFDWREARWVARSWAILEEAWYVFWENWGAVSGVGVWDCSCTISWWFHFSWRKRQRHRFHHFQRISLPVRH